MSGHEDLLGLHADFEGFDIRVEMGNLLLQLYIFFHRDCLLWRVGFRDGLSAAVSNFNNHFVRGSLNSMSECALQWDLIGCGLFSVNHL